MHPIFDMWDIKKPTFSDKDKLHKNILYCYLREKKALGEKYFYFQTMMKE